ncbi:MULTISPECIES: hypothetical protein [Niastella]|uniref:Uncharacterized protein n=1 Tax=Niastella soli TaxID=2821487 RepID=A0ABS3YYY8_9BACT|nr:hypothetical protein [Niastella soli]MBO9203144.1 hypothetical protein [Niastella soli]
MNANYAFESVTTLDTWGRLLYKVDNNVKKAIKLEEKAITLLRSKGYSTRFQDEVVDKMRKGTLLD